MKILLFGKKGQVGWELQRSLAPLGELVAVDFDSQDLCGDFTRLDGIAQTVRIVSPDVIVNAAAHTAVDKAEDERERVRVINALAPATLAREARKLDAWLIHYSTDYVFDGSGSKPRVETDPTAPLNVYGQTKLEAEKEILESGCHHLIFRTSWVFAALGGNFAKTMLRLAQERDRLTIIDDQIGAPTGADLLADVLPCPAGSRKAAECIRSLSSGRSGRNLLVWLCPVCFKLARESGLRLKVAPENILPVPTSAFPSPATRPKNSRLDTEKLQSTFDLNFPSWQTGVARMLTETLEKNQ